MRFRVLVFFISISSGILLSGCDLLSAVVATRLNWRKAEHQVRAEKEVPIRLSDGTSLVSEVYHPVGAGKTPTVLVRIPFSKSLKNSQIASIVGHLWAERGYTAVIQGTRGRYRSTGSYYPLIHERKDGIETLAWLAEQPWYDGQIATWGGSAFGYTQWAVSDQKDPGPDAMMIYESSTDFHRMFYPGGAFSLHTALTWALTSRGETDLKEWPSPAEIVRASSGFPLIDSDRRATGEEIAFFRDWVRHTRADSYWQEIDGKDRARQLKAPVLLLAGWYDPFLPSMLQDFQEIKKYAAPDVARRTRLVIGPWTHAGQIILPGGRRSENFRLKSLSMSIPWFDEILRNDEPSSSKPVQIFVMGNNTWREETSWPLKRAETERFFLDGDSLVSVIPAREDHQGFDYDPRDPVPTTGGAMIGRGAGRMNQNRVETRKDILLYTGSSLEQDLEVTGPVKAELFVSSNVPCTDFTAKLVDVEPDGSAYNVCDGIIRADFKPGAIKKIEISLWPTSMVFAKGHRIRLEVSSSNFPRYDRNPNTGGDIPIETRSIVAHQKVHFGGKYPSLLILPVVPAAR